MVLVLVVVVVSLLAGSGTDSAGESSAAAPAVAPELSGDGSSGGGAGSADPAAGSAADSVTSDQYAGTGAGGSSAGSAAAPSTASSVAEPGTASKPGAPSSAARPAGVEPRIVRTGTTTVEVAPGKVDAALRGISAAATGLGGYTSASESSGTPSTSDDEAQSASVTLRVPTASFDRLRDAVAEAGTVRTARMSSQDVTAQYVDLEARKRALETSRTTYLTMLGQAKTVGETLSVQQQIDGVQVQIEQIEGQRRVLADASGLATLTVQIREEGAGTAPPKPSERSGLQGALQRSWDRFVDGLEEVIAAIGTIVLVGLLLGLIYAGYRLVRLLRRRGRRPAAGAGAGAAGDPPGGPAPTP